MELYATAREVDAAEAALARASASTRGERSAVLAWHLRQRDTARAQALAHAVPNDDPYAARARLVLAECACHFGWLDEASAECRQASLAFVAAADAAGEADAALLAARVAEARGDRTTELDLHRQALAIAQKAGLAERAGHLRAALLLASGFGDPATLSTELAAIREAIPQPSVTLEVHLAFIDGIAAFQRGDFTRAVPLLTRVVPEAEAAGMIEQAVRAEMGLVAAYSNLGDRESACKLAEVNLARTRALGWTRYIGHSLSNLARQLFEIGEAQRAVTLLEEARGVLAAQPRSRAYAIARYYLGDACLELDRPAEALEHLEAAVSLMREQGARPEVACLLAIRATALSRLGRAHDALASAREALGLAREIGSRLWEVEALRALAEIHATHRIPPEGGERPESAALAFLREAVTVVDAIGGHHEKSELYGEMARAHEAVGDLASALAAERLARAEQEREASRQAANRVLLAQVRYDTERQRVIAAAESERARVLQTELDTLEQLRRVGQDITSNLDAPGMLRALDRHLGRLADVSFIGVFVLEGGRLRRHLIERGRMLPGGDIPLADFESYTAQAARDRRELYVETEEGGRPANRVPSTEATHSLWFAPLEVNGELLGVLTVQTPRRHAYGEREKLIFRTVSGYAAVALANARAHGALGVKHQRLAETEAEMRRLASTDALTGLANRRSFLQSAEKEVARVRRYGGAVGLVMADLDRFKAINDAAGHAAGDRVIVTVAEVLRDQQRPNDAVGRMGGEEFALLLPGASLADAARAAERIRAAVEALAIAWEGRALAVTMSLGVAAAGPAELADRDDAAVVAALLRDADAALYAAKRAGRNQALAATP